MNTNKKFALMLTVMALAALCLRLYWVIKVGHVSVTGTADQEGYVNLARSFQDPRHITHYTGFYVTPGYPGFTGAIMGLQARLGMDYPPRLVIGVAQAFLSMVTIVFTALLARRRTGSAVAGLVAAAIMSFWIGQITAVGSVMAEHLATPMIVVLIYMVSGETRAPKRWWLHALAAGFLLGLITLTKPLYLPLVVVVLAVLAIRNMGRRKLLAPALALAGLMTLLGPWMFYVHWQTGHTTIGTAFGLNLCFGNNPNSTASWSDEALEGFCHSDNLNDPARDGQLRDKAMKWMVENPEEQPRLMRLRWRYLFERDYGNFSNWYYPGLWEDWNMPLSAERWEALNANQWRWIKWLAPLGLIAMFLGRHRRFAWESLAYTVAMLLITMLSVADPRYRDPITPLMAIWVAYLIVVVPTTLARRVWPHSPIK